MEEFHLFLYWRNKTIFSRILCSNSLSSSNGNISNSILSSSSGRNDSNNLIELVDIETKEKFVRPWLPAVYMIFPRNAGAALDDAYNASLTPTTFPKHHIYEDCHAGGMDEAVLV
jgi:hypothetical protein